MIPKDAKMHYREWGQIGREREVKTCKVERNTIILKFEAQKMSAEAKENWEFLNI